MVDGSAHVRILDTRTGWWGKDGSERTKIEEARAWRRERPSITVPPRSVRQRNTVRGVGIVTGATLQERDGPEIIYDGPVIITAA